MVTTSKCMAIITCLLLLARAAPVVAAQPATATPLQHVIIIVQENHTFDNYFGTYPTANGTLVTPVTSHLPGVDGIPDGVCVPYGSGCISPARENFSIARNPMEGQLDYEMDYANNATGFAQYSGVQSMVYFDYRYIPAYWDYAEEYGIADNYFAPVMGMSNPNRLMMLAADSPASSDYPPPPHIPYTETLMSQLDGSGVTWGYFDWLVANGSQWEINPLDYISGMTPRAVSDVQDIPSLYDDLRNGSGLPDVSFVSSLGNATFDEHPGFSVTMGERWVVSVVDRVMNSSYWNSTAIFLTWDEGGGFYDHVVPPIEFTIDHNFTSPLLGLGQRVPLLVISPYTKESYVSTTLMSHLSLIHFIEYNWKLAPLNSLVANSNLPVGFFDFSRPPRAPMVLAASGDYNMSTYPLPLQPLRTATPFGGPVASALWSHAAVIATGAAVLFVAGGLLWRRKKAVDYSWS